MIKSIGNYGKFKYVKMVPNDFCEDKKYPLIVMLHGAGSRGNDIDVLYNNPYFTEVDKYEYEAVSVAPQCYANSWFDIFEGLQDFADAARNLPFVDKNRCYLIGPSMGGYGTWQLGMTHPEWFAAIMPICGGGMYWNAGRLKNVPVWAFHGLKDKTVLPEESKKMVDALNAAGGNAKLTTYEDIGHNAWIPAYNSTEAFEWLFSQKLHTGDDIRDNYSGAKEFG